MITPSIGATSSASRWGPLWGARPADWAVSEDLQLPTYEEALRRVPLGPGHGAATGSERLGRRWRRPISSAPASAPAPPRA